MTQDPYIAVAWGSPGGATAEISNAIEGLTGKRPKLVRLSDLAGPNETIQILLRFDNWTDLVKPVAVIFGTVIIQQAAKATWKTAAPKFSQATDAAKGFFGGLVSAVGQALRAKASIVLGFPRTPLRGRRHIGIELCDGSPEELARMISLLAMHGAEIERRLDQWDQMWKSVHNISYEENSDCSVKIRVSDEGAIQLCATIFEDSFAKGELVLYELVETLDETHNPM